MRFHSMFPRRGRKVATFLFILLHGLAENVHGVVEHVLSWQECSVCSLESMTSGSRLKCVRN